ncbi:interleukin-7 receptor subunit alpha [Seriola aureovittata]|uniref:interleukin-7 receptor subunit alpha n=2 Tax=Seriola TaxID=8160 RepID=UPI0024BD9A7E|nr:interleukin-7 receptor subunit alpha [Seriola aureovittata]
MLLSWGVALLLLLGGGQAQSGDGDTHMEPRISCCSHITTEENSLTCRLLGGRTDDEDDEDDDEDGIKKMTLCYTDWNSELHRRVRCVHGPGNTISFKAKPVVDFNLTAELRRGGMVSTTVDLRRIVKPRRPQVWNVTFSPEAHQALIHIRTPYHKDYLRVDNQLFQLHIWTTGRRMIQNVSSEDTMRMDMEHLQRNTQYHVEVRSIPAKFFRGSWSEWSDTFSFFTPAEEDVQEASTNRQEVLYGLMVCLVPVVLVTFSLVFFWKNKIFTYMWPSIPRPKDTLVQICKPNKGLLLNFNPEEFSALKVCPVERTDVRPCENPESSVSPAAADSCQSSDPCSTQNSDCRSTTSISTEELELSALLSRGSSDGEDSLHSASPSPVNVLQLGDGALAPQAEGNSGGNETEVFGGSQQEEAYVTMSSFYQIK